MRLILLDKDNKIIDKCSGLFCRIPNPDIPDSMYFETDKKDLRIGDTWDSENNISLKDSPKRFEVPPKTELELLKEEVSEIKKKLGMK